MAARRTRVSRLRGAEHNYNEEATMKRPTGVTIVAVIAIVYGIFNMLLTFLALVGIGLEASGVGATLSNRYPRFSVGTLTYAAISDAVLGILFLVFGIGALSQKAWAWTLGIVVLVLVVVRDIVGDVISGFSATSIVTSVIALLLLWYLFRPDVRAAFGRAA
jgi:hypothetical protein